MLKKLLGAAVLLAAMTSVAGAETIAEYDFGKEVLRVQAEEGFVCEYDTFADKISESTTWDGGKALRVNSDYDLLPADDADGKLTYTYTVNVPYTGDYKILFQATGAGKNSSAAYHSQWDVEIDGAPAAVTKTEQRTVDITTIYYYVAELEAGNHTIAINIPKAASGNNTGKTCGRFYYTMDYISFHYYYDIEHNFSSVAMRDAAAANATYGAAYGEMIRFTGGKTEDCYALFNVNAPEDGYYVIDVEAQREDLGSISQFGAYINNTYMEPAVLQKLLYATPAYNTTSGREGERQYLRKYQFTAYLKKGDNTLKFVALNDGHTNQWLLMDKLTVSTMPAPTADKVRLEGEHAYNVAEAYGLLTHGSAKLVAYKDFSNGITLQTYGTRSDSSTDELELKYIVEAPAAGAYNLGMLCNSSGSDFDMVINNVRHSSVRSNSTRTTNAIASSSSGAASDMYLYSYNSRVYLAKGSNDITVYVKPRSGDSQLIVDIDYFDFNLKEADATEPELAITGVVYNGFDNAPQAGTNGVEFCLTNTSPFNSGDVYVIAAVYGAEGLKDAQLETTSVATGVDEYVSISNLTYESGDTIKIFAWRKADLRPLVSGIYTYAETNSEE